MRNQWKKWSLCLFGLFVLACSEPVGERHEVKASFYHWQSKWKSTPVEKAALEHLRVEKIYLRFFDLDWSATHQEVIPVSALKVDTTESPSQIIVPTIFITNRSFDHLDEKGVSGLATKMQRKIDALWEPLGSTKMEYLQVDCDWSGRTQKLYFQLLEELQKKFPKVALSATIRLHQIKYREKTGVPPVARGMLMFYNMGKVADPQTLNSIYEWSTAEKYLDRLPDYPLDLDLALPIFSWGVLFRNGKMIKLLNNLRQEDLLDTRHFKILDGPWVEVVKSTYIQGHYLYQGDRLRLEWVPPETLVKGVDRLGKKISNQQLDLVFYHLDSSTLKHYSYAQLQNIVEALAKP